MNVFPFFVLCALAVATAAGAQDDPATPLERIVVSSAAPRPLDAFDTPASISVVALDDDVPAASLVSALSGVPGVAARDRQNQAQDAQLSIRGFGARATFGVRGLRLYVDGIPATMPDGQGQLSHFGVFGADRLDVLRGPFSALYGSSSGGVVQAFSGYGDGAPQVRVQGSAGGNDSTALGVGVRGGDARLRYNASASVADTGGYRDHSAARREWLNAVLRVTLGDGGSLDLVANRFHSPDAQDPLGLSRAEVLSDPSGATAAALQYDTRKSATQNQAGAILEQTLGGGHALRAMVYAGRRTIAQYLAVPVAAQGSPLSAGGVVDLRGDYGGGDLRWTWRGEFASRAFDVSAGVAGDEQRQQRRGYENFVGEALGVRGALRRDERNTARNRDVYAQAWWALAARWSLTAGARRSEVRYASDDRYVAAGNPDDSGRAVYARTTPVAGLVFAPRDDWRVYLSAGHGFETPTFNELGYRADGAAGLAFDLRPARSVNVEFGAKWRGTRGAQWEAAVFQADTDDELAVARNVGGRSSFRNVGRARRAGFELAGTLPLGEAWQLALAYTRLDATFRDAFPICAAAGCTAPNTPVTPGTRIPGVAARQFAGRLAWRRGNWSTAAQVLAIGDVTVNDAGSARAPGYGLVNLEGGRRWMAGGGVLQVFARIDNAFDRRYIGSVIVNEGNGRYYEPGPDRTAWLGVRWDWRD